MAIKPNEEAKPSDANDTRLHPVRETADTSPGLIKQVNFILRPNAIVAEGGARVIFVCG
jgi:hypothetical protein